MFKDKKYFFVKKSFKQNVWLENKKWIGMRNKVFMATVSYKYERAKITKALQYFKLKQQSKMAIMNQSYAKLAKVLKYLRMK
jgi:hypothetical protein